VAKLPRVLRVTRALQERHVDTFVGVHGPAGGPTRSPFGSPHAPVRVGSDVDRVLYSTPRDTRTTAEVIEDMIKR
jgi:hypothetical protein